MAAIRVPVTPEGRAAFNRDCQDGLYEAVMVAGQVGFINSYAAMNPTLVRDMPAFIVREPGRWMNWTHDPNQDAA